MSDELLDIFDENNQPLGFSKLRSEVHRDGDWHRTVHVHLLNGSGKFLVHLRSPHKDHNPNCYDTRFGGHIKAGGSAIKTAVSELLEEIGWSVDERQLMAGRVYKTDHGMNRQHSYNFYCVFTGDIKGLQFADKEVVKVRWMTADQILKSMEKHPKGWAGSIGEFQDARKDYEKLKKSLK